MNLLAHISELRTDLIEPSSDKKQQQKWVKFDKTVLAPYALKSQLTFDIDDF